MLIRNAGIHFGPAADVRIEAGRIVEIAAGLRTREGEPAIDADGAALIPGLHDHHLHLQSLAAARASIRCGPPDIAGADALASKLRAAPGTGWLRGIGYHESVAGEIDRHWLDAAISRRPVRIQHRGGRLWVLNSRALEELSIAAGETTPLEREGNAFTGRLHDADDWLRRRLHGVRPDLAEVGRELAALGITGITDASPRNGRAELDYFAAEHARGALPQAVRLMGGAELDGVTDARIGEFKVHLHEPAMPVLDAVIDEVRNAHAAGRCAAFHCVTRAELVFALGVLREAGVRDGDRIEHASVATPELVAQVRELGLTVVSQPLFVAERGDRYLQDVDADDRPWLYRLAAWREAGVPLAAGSDAPFGSVDPWKAMHAAVTRTTAGGARLGEAESLAPEDALSLYTGDAAAPGSRQRRVEAGQPADLCLLDRPWSAARTNLAAVRPRLVLREGARLLGV